MSILDSIPAERILTSQKKTRLRKLVARNEIVIIRRLTNRAETRYRSCDNACGRSPGLAVAQPALSI
jgi:hypothetical protein